MKKLILAVCVLLVSMTLVQAQEITFEKTKKGKKEKLHVKVKEGAEPDIYVDGKKFDFSLDLIDTDMIAFAAVIKGDRAIKEYNAPNGVIVITTQKKYESDIATEKISSKDKKPVIIIDGKVSTNEILDKLTPDDIEKIEVFKDEMAIKKYKAPNGVIVITTKKKNKKKKE